MDIQYERCSIVYVTSDSIWAASYMEGHLKKDQFQAKLNDQFSYKIANAKGLPDLCHHVNKN